MLGIKIGLGALSCAVGLAAFLLSGSSMQDGEPKLNELKVVEDERDDLSRLLHVEKVSGSYSISGKAAFVGITLEIQRPGQEVQKLQGPRLPAGKDGVRNGKFSIQFVDLDYLRLGDSPKNHSRLLITLQEKGQPWSAELNVPKADFDFTAFAEGGSSRVTRFEDGRAPLFWRKGKRPDGGVNKNAPKEETVVTAYLTVHTE